MRNLELLALGLTLTGCAGQRTETAQDPRTTMVGMQQEQVIACMGAPARKTLEAAGEVWEYSSDARMTVANASTGANSTRFSSRLCDINIVFSNGHVSAVNFTGPTGGLPVSSDQCANAVNPCVKQH